MKVFVFDANHCNGCYNCQIACKDEHCDNDWLPIAASQPNSGQFWCKVSQIEHGQLPKVRVEYWPFLGGQNPQIAEYAPEVLAEREDGLQVILPEKAKGRKDIAEKFEGVYWNEDLQIPQACTGCAHLVDQGKLPHCVDLCATGALRFGEYEEFADELAQNGYEFKNEREGELGPHVYYMNMPHLFIGGEVWDPQENEIIEDAAITLTLPDGSVQTTKTDDFGDFWFRKLDAGTYSLSIAAAGYKGEEVKDIALDKSLNLGDFPLEAC